MAIIITKTHFDKIIKHCKEYFPAEAGGFLGGKGDVILGIFPIPNMVYMHGTGEERKKFQWGDWDIIRITEFFKEHNMDLIGFYHSHPDVNIPIPSHKDFESLRARFIKKMMIVSMNKLRNTKVAIFTILPKYVKEKLVVIKDEAIKKYLIEFDKEKVNNNYFKEMQKLEDRVSKIKAGNYKNKP